MAITIIEKQLGLDERSWTNKDGSIRFRYRAYIWNSVLKKRTYITLNATNQTDAKKEAFEVWAKHKNDLDVGNDIGVRRKKIRYFLDLYLDAIRLRVERKNLSEHRLTCLTHTMKQLERFSKFHKEPDLDRLAVIYSREVDGYNYWRGKQKAQKTGKPITNRTLNNEMTDHKSFFNWCITHGYSTVQARTKDNELIKSNFPFPNSHYPKLCRVAQTDIEKANGAKRKWSKANYFYVILLMNGIGCRVVEVKNLRWSDLTYNKKGDAFLYIHGKGKERSIQIPLRVAEHLERLRKFKKHWGHHFNWNEKDHPYIFSSYGSETPPRHFDPEYRRDLMERAGVNDFENFQYVCFRHKFITDALKNGVHSLQVAKYTGTSQRMIEKTYEGLIPKDVFDMVFKDVPQDALVAKSTMPKFLGVQNDDDFLLEVEK
ncbi:MAG: site-specific integrase [Gammaproteobacteria bacterium]